MTMFRRRPGQTRTGLVFRFPTAGDVRDALLDDFDIDDDQLKEEHKKYLAETMRWMVDHLAERKRSANPGERAWKVSIDGFASRTGDARHNDMLSVMREQSVAAYFTYYLAMKPEVEKETQLDTRFHGFRDTPVRGENAWYRSARVVVHRPGFVPPPRPIPDHPSDEIDLLVSDASSDIVNALDRFFSLDAAILVHSVAEMARRVLDHLNRRPGAKIRTLTISGHGAVGFQAVGAGTEWDSTGDKSLQVDNSTPEKELLGNAAKQLPLLRGKFARVSVVNLTGCQVAKGAEGLDLLRAVSRAMDVAVQGGQDFQRPLVPGWEGNVYRCYRNTCWIARYGYLRGQSPS